MSESISDNEKPHIWTYIGLFFFMLLSGLMTAFGYANSAWIVVSRTHVLDEFQRGVKGLDCYRMYRSKSPKCLPWHYSNRSAKFPLAFQKVQEASIMLHVAYYIALVIIVNQMFWLCYAFKYCCRMNYCKSVKKYRLAMFTIMSLLVAFWIILFGMFVYEVSVENILPENSDKSLYKYQIGRGCWCFFAGMLPFIGAVYCFSRLTIRNRHLRISTKESTSGNSGTEVSVPMTETST